MKNRPYVGDRIEMPNFNGRWTRDAEVRVGDIPEAQPLEASGVLIVKDQHGNQHMVATDDGTWITVTVASMSDDQFEAYKAYVLAASDAASPCPR